MGQKLGMCLFWGELGVPVEHKVAWAEAYLRPSDVDGRRRARCEWAFKAVQTNQRRCQQSLKSYGT